MDTWIFLVIQENIFSSDILENGSSASRPDGWAYWAPCWRTWGRLVRLLEGPFVVLAQIRPLQSWYNIALNGVHYSTVRKPLLVSSHTQEVSSSHRSQDTNHMGKHPELLLYVVAIPRQIGSLVHLMVVGEGSLVLWRPYNHIKINMIITLTAVRQNLN